MMEAIKINSINRKRGFTLIELVMSLVILSIVGAFTGMWFLTMINGYVLAKNNAATVQNAEIITARLAKELSSTGFITSGNQTSLTFLSKSTNPVDESLVLSWDSGTQKLSLGTDVLANQVASFNLKYLEKYDDAGGESYLPASTALIKITLSLTGADNVAATFEERVFLYSLMTGI
ncbi:MAG: prepilin-type N-terminal cleavage/methylation domain-containing protein [Proteobacteria bacterium]|nr:prepilin-type N-terminal cleavage/methylation domain-containing protein [Pseudomonadota bacterium]